MLPVRVAWSFLSSKNLLLFVPKNMITRIHSFLYRQITIDKFVPTTINKHNYGNE